MTQNGNTRQGDALLAASMKKVREVKQLLEQLVVKQIAVSQKIDQMIQMLHAIQSQVIQTQLQVATLMKQRSSSDPRLQVDPLQIFKM